ncbi:MAG: SDR family NAD(P)-dependent oxidoreductase [Alphaproteobacteria bacterium]
MAYKAFDLSGKVAVVTGGNGGIGLGYADAIAQAGADVCIWGTNEAKNKLAAHQLAKHGRRVHHLVCDVSRKQDVDTAFERTLDEMGRVDAVFANAGVSGSKKSYFEIDEAEWRRVLGINLDGVHFTFQTALRHMVARSESGDGGGRLIVTASLASLSGAARNEHYAATKGAVIALVRALAVEFARYGITANAILPGWIETDMTADAIAWSKFADAVLPRVPMRRWGRPADFGGIAVYLMSEASNFHTGDSILIDGGYWIF